MCEKRFKLGVDEQYGAILDNDKILHKDEIVELLNALHEKNEQLRKENRELEKFRYSVFQKMNELIL